MEASTDDKVNVTKEVRIVLEKVEKIVGKGENAGYPYNFLKSVINLYQTISR